MGMKLDGDWVNISVILGIVIFLLWGIYEALELPSKSPISFWLGFLAVITFLLRPVLGIGWLTEKRI